MNCLTCRYCAPQSGGKIDCENTAAAPRTVTYAGSGAHPVRFDPDIVEDCGEWDLAAALYVVEEEAPAVAA